MNSDNSYPLVTFGLITYRQAEFIAESVLATLAQDYPNLEIILSDDCSPDSTFKKMVDLVPNYHGPHQIILNVNPENLGLARHVNRICELAKGEILVIGAGDDISEPNRVSEIVKAFQRNPSAYSIYSDAFLIDQFGNSLPGSLRGGRTIHPGTPYNVFHAKAHAYGCTHAWRIQSYSWFGPLHPNVVYEDQALSMRSSLLGEIVYIDKPLVHYRLHASNLAFGKHSLDLHQFQIVYQRKLEEANQFLRDVEYFIEHSTHDRNLARKTENAIELARKIRCRVWMLWRVNSVKDSASLVSKFKVLPALLSAAIGDRSIFFILLQKAFPRSILIKSWLNQLRG